MIGDPGRCPRIRPIVATSVPAAASKVAAGENHTCALLADGSVRCWGDNRFGQLDVPVDLGQVSAIRAGANHTCVIVADDAVRCWGGNTYLESTVPGFGKVEAPSPSLYLPYMARP